MAPPADEAQSLRRCVRDLAALSALSATWDRADVQEVAGSLADVLLRSLDVEFVYIRVSGLATGIELEVLRSHASPQPDIHDLVREVGGVLEPFLTRSLGEPPEIANPLGEGTVRLFIVPMGYDGDCGFVVAASRQPGFPEQTDRLLLTVAANQAAVVLQHKRTESAFQEMNRRKDEFLAILAHELRNPLAPIRNALEIMGRAREDPPAVERARTMMERQVRQMVRLVDDLMDISRITQNKIELREEEVDLGAVIQSAVEATQPLIAALRHRLTVTVPPGPLSLRADPSRLAQVFANLLDNAAKYTDEGGDIRLTVERREGDVLVRIRDTGIGIPAAMLPRIFDTFTQVDRSLERSQNGLGIGLSLVRGLVELHGGGVEAQSAGIGQGSELTVRLPLHPAPRPAVADAAAAADHREAAAMQSRILVVDDYEDSRESLALFLSMLGSEVRTAQDGLEAVEAAATFRPDVVLLDIGMPKLNGYEAARRIREQSQGDRVVLVALTGWAQDEDRQRSKEAGFDFHLVKPVDPAALKRLLAELPAFALRVPATGAP
jgi:signal transduction histidine kinase/ActR/RegA family two-component response regulator